MRMKIFALGLMLAAAPAIADPAPTQTPAQIEKSDGAATSEQMQSPAARAEAQQAHKPAAQVAANADKKVVDNGHNDGGATAVPEPAPVEGSVMDNGHNDGGAVVPQVKQ
jgi:hypothetical protein